jgi:DNA-binding transcriptional MerR regulator
VVLMDVDAMRRDAGSRPGGSWTPGTVAALLGVSPVTLRTWASRYGVGPSLRADRRHRRYSDADVRKLQHMQRLIERGMRAREAAAVVFAGAGEATPEVPAGQRIAELEQAVEGLRSETMAALLDETLGALGTAGAWSGVLVPVLRHLGQRWLRGDVCFELEWAFTAEVSLALQRYGSRFAAAAPGRVVLLSCCPGERHTLPMEVLRAAMAEVGIPAVFLGQMVPGETTVGTAAKLDPVLVLLWSMSPGTADDPLRRRLKRRGFAVAVAGPGWEGPEPREDPWADDLETALALAAEHLKA